MSVHASPGADPPGELNYGFEGILHVLRTAEQPEFTSRSAAGVLILALATRRTGSSS